MLFTRTVKYMAMTAIAGVLILLGVIFFVIPHDTAQDSGVLACQEMAENVERQKTQASTSKMTSSQYKKARQKFEKSEHLDIRQAGTRLVDTVVKAESTSENDLGGNLQAIVDLGSHLGDLRVACANHGIYVPAQS